MKSVHIRSYSGPHFPAFGLNTERHGITKKDIQSESGIMRTRITPNTDTFYPVKTEAIDKVLKKIMEILIS